MQNPVSGLFLGRRLVNLLVWLLILSDIITCISFPGHLSILSVSILWHHIPNCYLDFSTSSYFLPDEFNIHQGAFRPEMDCYPSKLGFNSCCYSGILQINNYLEEQISVQCSSQELLHVRFHLYVHSKYEKLH